MMLVLWTQTDVSLDYTPFKIFLWLVSSSSNFMALILLVPWSQTEAITFQSNAFTSL